MITFAIYSHRQGIEFRDVTDIKMGGNSHNVAPNKPAQMCDSSGSTLLYEDWSKNPIEVHMVFLEFTPTTQQQMN